LANPVEKARLEAACEMRKYEKRLKPQPAVENRFK
jgi:hypothetical protein